MEENFYLERGEEEEGRRRGEGKGKEEGKK